MKQVLRKLATTVGKVLKFILKIPRKLTRARKSGSSEKRYTVDFGF
jgi:hypothetical protein